MTAEIPPNRSDIVHTLGRWKNWLRLHRAVWYATLGFGIGTAGGWAAGVAGILTARILQAEFVRLVPSAGFVLGVALGIAGYLLPISTQHTARYFDRLLNLKERVSTALELRLNPAASRNPVEQLQIEDAHRVMQHIQIQQRLRLQPSWQAIMFGILLILAMIPMSRFAEGAFQLAAKKRSIRSALTEQAAAIESLIEETDAQAVLPPGVRQESLAVLNETASQLEEAESFAAGLAALDTAQAALKALSDPTAGPTVERIRQAASAEQSDDPAAILQQLAAGDIEGAAKQLQSLDSAALSAAEVASLAGTLDDLSEAVEETSPPLAAALAAASDALESGNGSDAEQGLENAGDALSALADSAAQTAPLADLVDAVGSAQEELTAAGRALAASEPGPSAEGGGSQADGDDPAGSGRGDPSGEAQEGNPTGDDPIGLANDPSDLGLQAFSDLYSPYQTGIDAIPGQSVVLPAGDEPRTLVTGEGEQSPPAPGASRVPFVEVYPDYENLWRQAIDTGIIPPDLILVVQEYFAGLEP